MKHHETHTLRTDQLIGWLPPSKLWQQWKNKNKKHVWCHLLENMVIHYDRSILTNTIISKPNKADYPRFWNGCEVYLIPSMGLEYLPTLMVDFFSSPMDAMGKATPSSREHKRHLPGDIGLAGNCIRNMASDGWWPGTLQLTVTGGKLVVGKCGKNISFLG